MKYFFSFALAPTDSKPRKTALGLCSTNSNWVLKRSGMRSPVGFICIGIALSFQIQHAAAEWKYNPVSILEEEPISTTPLLVIASTDAASYDVEGDGVPDTFRFDKNTGELWQLKVLDREKKSLYTMKASAFDANGVKVEKDTDLKIVIIDINDKAPVFDKDSLFGSVPEINDGSSFMTLHATDEDIGGNANITYYIKTGGDKFKVNAITGEVSTIGNLDYETDQVVTFEVTIKDSKFASNDVTDIVTVTVLDSNDHPPVFEKTPDKAVSELFPLNMPLYVVTASDVDEKDNKKVYFKIDSGNNKNTFYVDSTPSDTGPSKGTIKLQKPLDFESEDKVYSLTIMAYNKDAGENVNEMSAKRTLTIKVTDENEPPKFLGTPYSATVTEAVDPDGNELTRVTAEDLDFGRNQSVFYEITNDPQGWFTIDSEQGVIKMIGKVDRESRSVEKSSSGKAIYTITVTATDNYDHGNVASGSEKVRIIILDVNDNSPMPGQDFEDKNTVRICEKPVNKTVTVIKAEDADSSANGPPFVFAFDPDVVDTNKWRFEPLTAESSMVVTLAKNFEVNSEHVLPFTIVDGGSPAQTGTSTLTVKICQCDDEGNPECSAVQVGGFIVPLIVAIAVVLLLIIILVFALVAYRRRREAQILKEPFFDDEDDVRENIQNYQEEGGEEDQEAYDLSALRVPLMSDPNTPIRIEKPLQQAQPRIPRGIPDDIGDYIGDAKDQADRDPSAPPFDSLLVFDYEGAGSDAGSLSSINTATTDGSMDYDHLNDWGPRFKRLADMYNGGSDSD